MNNSLISVRHSASFHMAVLDSWIITVITLNACTLDHLPCQLSLLKHLRSITHVLAYTAFPLLTTHRHFSLGLLMKCKESSAFICSSGLFIKLPSGPLNKCLAFMT